VIGPPRRLASIARPVAALAIVVAIGAIAGAGLPVAAPYARDARASYLDHALAAVRGLGGDGREALEQALYQGARARCRAALQTPSIACTIELADAVCDPRPDREPCRLAADVILTNQRAETELVDEATRMKLVASAADYHVALLAEIAARHGALAAELVLAEPTALTPATAAARIDRFCTHRRQGPDWQRCAAALIWYVGEKDQP